MQARRQYCRISSKPLVVFVPKYGFAQIREVSWGGRLPFPDLRAHDPLCACRRLPMSFCRGTFSMTGFGRDYLSHLSMSLHMELNRTYGTSRIACFIWRHTSSIALRSGQPRRVCRDKPTTCRLFWTQTGQLGQVPEAAGLGTDALPGIGGGSTRRPLPHPTAP